QRMTCRRLNCILPSEVQPELSCSEIACCVCSENASIAARSVWALRPLSGALAEQTGPMLTGGRRARVGFDGPIHPMECKHALRHSALLSWRYEGSIREGDRGGAPKPGPPPGRSDIPCRRPFGGWLDDHGCA